jgi:hypothetical protein
VNEQLQRHQSTRMRDLYIEEEFESERLSGAGMLDAIMCC